ncbi:hypothetical protein [Fulvivirga sedimenti]|uniref:Uncharacterized protein n=1 Tax=Fulvivirga sedimenti TaxID=2879465 RepID=A0A9X1KW40_9BACT|nr:hypothetical protein [Fulvivirga sedimenti]MCA6074330.1 hypothetical protein [Fulvivirga sedimenti]
MKKATLFFHRISYLQYPLMLIALYFIIQPYYGFQDALGYINKGLVFMGLGVTFSTLQDTTKTQNKLSLRIYQNPTYARIFIIVMIALILFFLVVGLIGLFAASDAKLSEVSLGMIVMGVGMIGMLKAVFEMADNHRAGE